MTVEVSTLSGGLTVATDRMPDLETTSVGVWVSAGARSEPLQLNGMSHLLEHMAFKGTRRRSARGIAEEIEGAGGHLNAYTSREQTAYFARVLKDDLPLAIDVLSDILQHSVFDETELARERDVVVQEIGEVNDAPDELIFDRLQEAAFPDQALGRAILGTAERVTAFQRDQLMDYRAAHYRAPGMVVSAAGAVDHGALCALAEDAFVDLSGGAGPEWEPARYVGGQSRLVRDLEQVHVMLAFPSVSYTDPDYHAVQVFSTVLGGGMSSRLFQEAREVRGLAYSIYSFAPSFQDAGLFGVYAGSAAERAGEVLDVACDEILSIADGLPEEEVARARSQHKAGLLMSLESSAARCEQLARQIQVYGRPVAPAEIAAHVDAVDADAVARVARRIARPSAPTLVVVGPHAPVEYEQLTSRFA